MKVSDANLQIGDRFTYPPWKNIWEVIIREERGLVACLLRSGSHKHFIDNNDDIEVVYKATHIKIG